MICPNPECPGRTKEPAEYREGVTRCRDCGTPLVEGDPEPDTVEYEEFVSVLTIAEASLVPIVKSLLASENIRFFIKGEGVQDLFGPGRLGSGFNIITGPPVVYVEPDRAEEARELLAEVESSPEGADDDDPA
jgi:Putative prokaryotic signal transducing protein